MCIISNYYGEKEYEQDEKLFYAIMYRQWSSVVDIVSYLVDTENKDWDSIKNQHFSDYEDITYEDITIEKCFKYNMDFLKSNKNQDFYCKLCEKLGNNFSKLENDFDFYTYDDKRFSKGKSVFDIFWNGNQPVLDLKYFEKQTLAAKQVMKNKVSMVLDEVGTGKTVAGIYTIQQIIQDGLNKGKDAVKILVICPYNKREDWHNDILRQLGLESTIIDQADDGSALKQRSIAKRRTKIYISGNKGGDGDGNTQQLKSSFLKDWDLVIVDECHSCFDSYKELKSATVLLLTATPIVVSSNGIREFCDYENRIHSIINNNWWSNPFKDKIKPIEIQYPTEKDFFVCNFKEDIFENIEIKRKIQFIECERIVDRNDWFNKLRNEDGFFSAIFSDQDDERLAKKMSERFPDKNYPVSDNYKLNTLINIVLGECRLKDSKTEESEKINYCQYKADSFIVFCETTGTVDLIYEKLSGYADDSLMIGKLHGQAAEIKNHQTNKTTILQSLKTNIRNGKRSVLITTGKSGGTGINLGEFSTVVHYELPFSSNELEQRFGRIERADDLINVTSDNGERKTIQNKMIFLINKSVEGEWDFVTNRMLYYSINKINITVKYMPIRNTVLFHPDYINRVTETATGIWENVYDKLKDYNIEDAFRLYQDTKKIKGTIENILNNDKSYSSKGIWTDIDYILNNTSGLEKESISSIREYVDTYKISSPELNEELEYYKNLIEYYLFLKKTLFLWGKWEINQEDAISDLDITNADVDTDTGTESSSDEKFIKSITAILNKLADNNDKISTIKTKIEDLLNMLKSIDSQSVKTYSGVFYMKDNQIVNKTFNERGQ